MEQSNKNITNADTLTSERERNLSKENGETQQANINDENVQDLDNQKPPEKDTVQPEDVSNAPTEKCKGITIDVATFRSVRKYIVNHSKRLSSRDEQLGKDTEYYHNVHKWVISVVKYSSIRGLAIRGTEKVFGSPHIGNFMGTLELLAEFDPFICEHVEQRELRPKSLISYLSKTLYEQIIEIMGKQIIEAITTHINNNDMKYYSIVMDSTPDLSHNDQITIVL
ncbi:zinc finger MYM-type protein 1 [Trichonephila clavipes]|nr:zinc finger MYM-type protein 1 [Trichonephila clavipes]